MVRGLIAVDRREIRAFAKAGNPFPPLYDGGLTYYPQGRQDDWKDAVQIFQSGGGSCNSLSAMRVAELLEAGLDAGPYIQTQIQRTKRGLVHVFHVIVWKGGPSTVGAGVEGLSPYLLPGKRAFWECPSRTLGMQSEPYD
jgi:hypothetical protein